MKTFPLIFIAILLNTFAQIGLKFGMRMIGHFEFTMGNIMPISLQLIRSPYIVGSIVLYVVSLFAWIMVLSRVDVSLAYPLTSLGYVLTAVAGYFFLNEGITLSRFVGIVVIILGVYLVARS